MDGESYENKEIAQLINKMFIPVKVDRDERPDIDRRHQNAVSAITGQGGWPLTAFLTEEGKVFFGGTYFPPEDMYGRAGFKTVLTRVSEVYRKEKHKAVESAQKISSQLEQLSAPTDGNFDLNLQVVEEAVQSIGKSFDIVNGGFGSAPKFPHTGAVELMLNRYFQTREEWLLLIARKTLERMALGGIYDQLGGGFHRYSVDEKWIVPHFEKMSYDNSELLKNYLHGYQVTGVPLFREIAEGIIHYVTEVASDTKRGGFYTSQDADISMHDDGDYFTWTLSEVEDVLSPEEAEAVSLYYNIQARGEMRENPAKNVLFVDMEPPAIAEKLGKNDDEVKRLLARGRKSLLETRAKRPMPLVDRTLYSNWNGMMASAFIEAYKVLGMESCKDQAIRTIERLLGEAYISGHGFYHSMVDGAAKIDGLLDDQVLMAQALLDAHEMTGNAKYLTTAQELMDYAIAAFWDETYGGFYDISRDKSSSIGLDTVEKPIQDAPTPSSNAVAILVLDRLYNFTQQQEYRDKAELCLKAFGPRCIEYGIYAATYFLALDYHIAPPAHAVIVGARGDEGTQKLWHKALAIYRPNKLVSLYDPADGNEASLPPAMMGMLRSSEQALAYVCAGNTCAMPTGDPTKLGSTLKSFGLSKPGRSGTQRDKKATG